MKWIYRYAYATVLMLSALNFAPTPASAQDGGGRFTLAQEVHWQDNIVPAGDYKFSVEPRGPGEMLVLHKVSGSGATFMVLVCDVDSPATANANQLVVVSRPRGRFVKTMRLPELTLHFTVPAESREVAQAVVSSTEVAAR